MRDVGICRQVHKSVREYVEAKLYWLLNARRSRPSISLLIHIGAGLEFDSYPSKHMVS